jgi:hypothetical protein
VALIPQWIKQKSESGLLDLVNHQAVKILAQYAKDHQ